MVSGASCPNLRKSATGLVGLLGTGGVSKKGRCQFVDGVGRDQPPSIESKFIWNVPTKGAAVLFF
jgi:hypothetical protein